MNDYFVLYNGAIQGNVDNPPVLQGVTRQLTEVVADLRELFNNVSISRNAADHAHINEPQGQCSGNHDIDEPPQEPAGPHHVNKPPQRPARAENIVQDVVMTEADSAPPPAYDDFDTALPDTFVALVTVVHTKGLRLVSRTEKKGMKRMDGGRVKISANRKAIDKFMFLYNKVLEHVGAAAPADDAIMQCAVMIDTHFDLPNADTSLYKLKLHFEHFDPKRRRRKRKPATSTAWAKTQEAAMTCPLGPRGSCLFCHSFSDSCLCIACSSQHNITEDA